MTDDMMNLRALVEKSADADLLREMIGYAEAMIGALGEGDILLADKGYDSDAIRTKARERRAWAQHPAQGKPQGHIRLLAMALRQRNLVEHF